jgi:preprotein translocase subunit SecA
VTMNQDQDRFNKRFERKREEEERYKKSLPGADDEPLPPPPEPVHTDAEPGRNDPCPCGSGKKYKQCCLKKKKK